MATIIVADDEKHIRERFALELWEEGHDVVTAASCRNLLNSIRTVKPDLLILDIKLVDCDSFELLLKIRDHHRNLRVILCSACDSYRNDPRSAAADYFVVKSCDLSVLKSNIDRALSAGGSGPMRVAG